MGHEVPGKDGIVSWVWAYDHLDAPWKRVGWRPEPVRAHFDYIFHVVRHPLNTMASALTEHSASWIVRMGIQPRMHKELCDHVLDKATLLPKTLWRALAYSWIDWNRNCLSQADWAFRVEDLPQKLPELASRLGVDYPSEKAFDIPTSFHSRRHPPAPTWEDMAYFLGQELHAELRDAAQHFGY